MYINDTVNNITSNPRLIANDTSLYVLDDNPDDATVKLNDDLIKVDSWSKKWLATLNPLRTESLILTI